MFVNFETRDILILNPKCASTFLRKYIKSANFSGPMESFSKLDKTWDYKGSSNWESVWKYTASKYNMHGYHSTMHQIVDFLKNNDHDPHSFSYFAMIRDPREWLMSNFRYCHFSENWTPKYFDLYQNALKDFSIPYHCDIERNKPYGHTLDDYIQEGYNLTKNICTSPLPINELIVMNKGYDIRLYKSEKMEESLSHLKEKYKSFKYINKAENKSGGSKNTSISSQSEKEIKDIFKYEYDHFYNCDQNENFIYILS